MAKSKIFLTGASGFLGGNFCKIYAEQFDIFAVWHKHPFDIKGIQSIPLDITDYEDLKQRFQRIKPDAVIHLGALSDPNECQLHPDISEKINIDASENLASLCAEAKIPLLFSSTDLVFDGKSAPYSEKDIPCPVNTYGLHKSIAEQAILDIYPVATICRLPLMFGASYNQGKSFLQPMLEKLSAHESLILFTDEYRSMASARDVCAGLRLCMDKQGEIIHLGGNDRMSRYEFAKKVCTIFEFDQNLLVKTKQRDVKMPAPRPKDVSLESEKAGLMGWKPGKIDDELIYIKNVLR